MTPMCSFYCKLRCHLHITQRFQWLHAEWETYPAHPSCLIGSAGSSGPMEGPEPLVCLKVTGAHCSIPSGSSAILGWNSRHRGGPRLVLHRVLDEFAFWKWEQNSFSQQCKFIRFEALDLRKKTRNLALSSIVTSQTIKKVYWALIFKWTCCPRGISMSV